MSVLRWVRAGGQGLDEPLESAEVTGLVEMFLTVRSVFPRAVHVLTGAVRHGWPHRIVAEAALRTFRFVVELR